MIHIEEANKAEIEALHGVVNDRLKTAEEGSDEKKRLIELAGTLVAAEVTNENGAWNTAEAMARKVRRELEEAGRRD